MEGWNFWWGVAAFFLGGLATQLNGWLAYRRQRQDRADDAADALRQRREEFELQHLVELNQLVRVATDRIFEYYTAERRHRAALEIDPHDDEPRRRTDEAGDAFMVALADLSAEVPFILADDIRQAAGNLTAHMLDAGSLMISVNHPFDPSALTAVANRLYQPLGERVRAIYAGQAT